MSYNDEIRSEVLDLLANLRDEYCAAHDISEERAREEVSVQVITLFESGALTINELREALGQLPESP